MDDRERRRLEGREKGKGGEEEVEGVGWVAGQGGAGVVSFFLLQVQ